MKTSVAKTTAANSRPVEEKPQTSRTPLKVSAEKRLERLKVLRKKNLISEEEYQKKRQEVIDSL